MLRPQCSIGMDSKRTFTIHGIGEAVSAIAGHVNRVKNVEMFHCFSLNFSCEETRIENLEQTN